MGHIVEGARILFRDPRRGRYLLVPWLWSTLIFLAVVVVGYLAVVPWLQSLLAPRESWSSGPLRALVAFLYFVLWIFIAGFVFLTITAITSSFLWEGLSAAVEESLTGSVAPRSGLSKGRLAMDSLGRLAFVVVISVVSLIAGWFIPIVAPVILAGWVGVLDYTAPAFLRYNRTVGMQWPVAMRMKGWFGFQLAAGFLTLLPVVNVFCLPLMVAGGTVMAVRSGVLRPFSSSTSPV